MGGVYPLLRPPLPGPGPPPRGNVWGRFISGGVVWLGPVVGGKCTFKEKQFVWSLKKSSVFFPKVKKIFGGFTAIWLNKKQKMCEYGIEAWCCYSPDGIQWCKISPKKIWDEVKPWTCLSLAEFSVKSMILFKFLLLKKAWRWLKGFLKKEFCNKKRGYKRFVLKHRQWLVGSKVLFLYSPWNKYTLEKIWVVFFPMVVVAVLCWLTPVGLRSARSTFFFLRVELSFCGSPHQDT